MAKKGKKPSDAGTPGDDCSSRLRIEYRPVADLVPYARNALTHSDAQIDQIANSIREFGWTNPVLVDGANGIVAGHGRVLAALKLGIKQPDDRTRAPAGGAEARLHHCGQ